MKKLRHPNILLFMGAVMSPQRLCIVSEFLPRYVCKCFLFCGIFSLLHIYMSLAKKFVCIWLMVDYNNNCCIRKGNLNSEILGLVKLRSHFAFIFLLEVVYPVKVGLVWLHVQTTVKHPNTFFLFIFLFSSCLFKCSGSLFRLLQRSATKLDVRRRVHMALDIVSAFFWLVI
jgi:hypothetical protein